MNRKEKIYIIWKLKVARFTLKADISEERCKLRPNEAIL